MREERWKARARELTSALCRRQRAANLLFTSAEALDKGTWNYFWTWVTVEQHASRWWGGCVKSVVGSASASCSCRLPGGRGLSFFPPRPSHRNRSRRYYPATCRNEPSTTRSPLRTAENDAFNCLGLTVCFILHVLSVGGARKAIWLLRRPTTRTGSSSR